MPDDLGERLLASYAGMSEAMVVQSVLEAGGVPCRVADLAHVPDHVFGVAGGLGRSVGVWVLEADVERATALLATLAATDGGVDEEALAAEALAAAPPGRVEPEEERGVAPGRVRTAPWFVRAALVSVGVLALFLVARGCR